MAKCQTEYRLKAQCCNFWDSAVRIEPILCKLNSIALPGKFNQFWIEAYNNFLIKRAKIVLDCLCHTTACGVWFCVLEGEILCLKKEKKPLSMLEDVVDECWNCIVHGSPPGFTPIWYVILYILLWRIYCNICTGLKCQVKQQLHLLCTVLAPHASSF